MFDRAVVFALFAATGLFLYGFHLNSAWQFDDFDAIVNNQSLHEGPTFFDRMRAPAQSPFAGRPVVSFTAAVNEIIAGQRPWAWRLFNLALHITNAWLAMLILLRLIPAPSPLKGRGGAFAFVVALIWLVHPVCTEPIMYVTQRTTLLMSLFYLATIYASLRGGRWTVAAVIFCALGMASKEAMVTAPLVVLLIDAVWRRWRPRLYASLAGTWVILAAIMMTGPRSATVGFDRGVSVFDYATNQCAMIVTYLKLAVWPHPLVFDYGYPHPIPVAVWLPCAVLLMAMVAASLWLWRRERGASVAMMLFLILLAPASSIVPITSEVGAERRVYLPLLCVIVLAVAALFHLRKTRRTMVVGVVCIVFSIMTVQRTADYQTPQRLWATVVESRPLNPRGHNNYARAIAPLQQHDEAIAHLRTAINLKPDYADAHFNLGVLLAMQGDSDEAAMQLDKAIALQPERDKWRQIRDEVNRQRAID